MNISFSHVEKQRARRLGRRGGNSLATAGRGFSGDQSCSRDLTFRPWAALRKCRRFSPGGVLRRRRRAQAWSSWRRPTSRRLQPRFCFRREYFCLIECLWIAGLCFCCVAQTNRCGVRDGAGVGAGGGEGEGGLGGELRGYHVPTTWMAARRVLFTCFCAPAGAGRAALLQAVQVARIPAAQAGCFPPLSALLSEIPPHFPITQLGQCLDSQASRPRPLATQSQLSRGRGEPAARRGAQGTGGGLAGTPGAGRETC